MDLLDSIKSHLPFIGGSVAEDEYDDDYEEDDMVEEEYEERPKRSVKKAAPKVSMFRSNRRSDADSEAREVCTICPQCFDDIKKVTDKLRDNVIVILNTESCDVELAKRTLDFCYGTLYALDGDFDAISVSQTNEPCGIYLFTPYTTKITSNAKSEESSDDEEDY
ncbi:MAG: cell division protein SepF [Lachnospiraceae bacterium]|nr:cell division protein SepF [Lachnospiraceae bacterium]